MFRPEEDLIQTMVRGGVDFLSTLPCDRVKTLIALSDRSIFRLPLTREEEGVGISAGAAMAGKRPAMIIQNSGLGNMVNAVLSLTKFYDLPLAIFLSHRGVYKEGIAAQVPMGKATEPLLKAMGMDYTALDRPEDIPAVEGLLKQIYSEGRVHAFLLSPALWEDSEVKVDYAAQAGPACCVPSRPTAESIIPEMTRFEMLKGMVPYLKGRHVITNLGIPSKEVFSLIDQPSNFYMLGSMGMATPIGLGVALAAEKPVVVIDGDGSLLMNPGTLATVAHARPKNLTIIAIDNASYGSTGCQETLTRACVDLEAVARGFGIADAFKASDPSALSARLSEPQNGPRFAHVLTLPGNANVQNIPLDPLDIRRRFEYSLN